MHNLQKHNEDKMFNIIFLIVTCVDDEQIKDSKSQCFLTKCRATHLASILKLSSPRSLLKQILKN